MLSENASTTVPTTANTVVTIWRRRRSRALCRWSRGTTSTSVRCSQSRIGLLRVGRRDHSSPSHGSTPLGPESGMQKGAVPSEEGSAPRPARSALEAVLDLLASVLDLLASLLRVGIALVS